MACSKCYTGGCANCDHAIYEREQQRRVMLNLIESGSPEMGTIVPTLGAVAADAPNSDTDEALIADMEAIRSANNVNWMNLVRLAMRVAPEDTRAILRDITTKDRQIAGIIQQLGEQR